MRVDERWPELFAGMDARIRESVVQAMAATTSENWEPSYETVKLLCDEATGRITGDEFRERIAASARHRVESERSAGVVRRGGDPHEPLWSS